MLTRFCTLAPLHLIVLLLTACPREVPLTGQPVVDPGDTSAFNGSAAGTPTAESGVDVVAEAQPGASTGEPANPVPTTPNWVWTERLTVRLGEPLSVEYKLADPAPDSAWIGLVPENVTDTAALANDKLSAGYASLKSDASGSVSIPLTQAGRFSLRLFSAPGAEGKLLAQSPVLTVEQMPVSADSGMQPPYVTLNPQSASKIEVQQGFPVIAYYEVPPDCPSSAWLSVVPIELESKLASDNMKANVSYMHIEGKSKGEYTWVAAIPGTYIFRLFPAEDSACYLMAESEPFTVIPEAP